MSSLELINFTAKIVGGANWYGPSMSSTGQYMVVCNYGGVINVSNNYGITWNTTNKLSAINSSATSSTGQYMAVCTSNGGYIYLSSDFGVTWITSTAPLVNWFGITMSSTGQYIAACSNSGTIHISVDYGANWGLDVAPYNKPWTSISMNSNGQYIIACLSSGNDEEGIYYSNNCGNSWYGYAYETPANFFHIATSSTGQYSVASLDSSFNTAGNGIYVSNNFGPTWNKVLSTSIALNWRGVTINSTGQYMAVCISNISTSPLIYVSNDYGSTWVSTYFNDNIGSSYIAMNSTGQQLLLAEDGAWVYSGQLYNTNISSGSTTCFGILQNYIITLDPNHYTTIIDTSIIGEGGNGTIDILNITSNYSTNLSFHSIYSTGIITQNQIKILNDPTFFHDPYIQVYFSYVTGQVSIYNSTTNPSCKYNITVKGSFTYNLPITISQNGGTPPGSPPSVIPVPFE